MYVCGMAPTRTTVSAGDGGGLLTQNATKMVKRRKHVPLPVRKWTALDLHALILPLGSDMAGDEELESLIGYLGQMSTSCLARSRILPMPMGKISASCRNICCMSSRVNTKKGVKSWI